MNFYYTVTPQKKFASTQMRVGIGTDPYYKLVLISIIQIQNYLVELVVIGVVMV